MANPSSGRRAVDARTHQRACVVTRIAVVSATQVALHRSTAAGTTARPGGHMCIVSEVKPTIRCVDLFLESGRRRVRLDAAAAPGADAAVVAAAARAANLQ